MRLTVNFHHDGNFVPSPFMYQEEEKSTIRDLEFEGMTVIRLSKLLQGTCMFPVKDLNKNFNGLMGVIYPEFDSKLPWNEMKPTLGLRFEHPEQLKECMTNYGVANGYQLWCAAEDHLRNVKNYLNQITKEEKVVQGQSSADKGKAEDLQGPSIADPTDSEAGDTGFMNKSKTVRKLAKIIKESHCITEVLKLMPKEGANLKELQKEQNHSSLAKMVQDPVLIRHGNVYEGCMS
ncbi:hypothetical protein Tco_0481815 [Tanacetum coccineum]